MSRGKSPLIIEDLDVYPQLHRPTGAPTLNSEEPDFSGPDYAVSLTWEGPVTSIKIGYRQGVRAHSVAFPSIWVSPVTFTPTVSA